MPEQFFCKVDNVGAGEGGNAIFILSHINKENEPRRFDHEMYYATASSRREMLATGLTALATGRDVSVELSDTARFSTIESILILT